MRKRYPALRNIPADAVDRQGEERPLDAPEAATPDGNFRDRDRKRAVTREFLVLFAFLVAGLAAIVTGALYSRLTYEDYQIRVEEKSRITLAANLVVRDFETVLADLTFLANSENIYDFLENPAKETRERAEREYLGLVKTAGFYDQARLIDNRGMELIRVNDNAGLPSIVAEDALQDKFHRFYVQASFTLAMGQYFVSRMDLNLEHGKIERPFKPMIRFAMPIFDRAGDKRRIVVLNYLAKTIIENFRKVAERMNGVGMLLNAGGYWLSSPVAEDEWGFMLGKSRTFGADYPEAWRQISKLKTGQIFVGDYMFTFSTVRILPPKDEPIAGPSPGEAEYEIDQPMDQIKVVSVYHRIPFSIDSFAGEWWGLLMVFFIMPFGGVGCWHLAASMVDRKFTDEQLRCAKDELKLKVLERTYALRQEVVEHKRTERNLQKAKEEAEFANFAKTEFLANMSHELRTPLNCIIGLSDIMKREMFGPLEIPQYLEYANDINASGNHLLRLISDILDVSKIESRRLDLEEEEVGIRDTVAACQKMVSVVADNAQVRLVTKIPDDFPSLLADPLRVKQIVINLLHNSIKFTQEHGRITTKCRLDETGGIVLTVEDTGIGIAVKDIPKILERFGQARKSHTNTHKGLGLGLAISKSLMEMHGGILKIDSIRGKGTTVTMRFPPERTIRDGSFLE